VIITHDRELAASLPRRISFRDGRVESDEVGLGGAPSTAPTGADGSGAHHVDGHHGEGGRRS